jgi:sn-glycerol 3-phosphate transport system ATP-binding protein
MADQVVLLKKGRVEQIGQPHELYERPQTTFAAQFMGSPPMNLLKLDLIEERSALTLACGGILPADRMTDGYIGVRPEHVHVEPSGLPVRVSATDYLGAETFLRLTHGGQTLFGKIDGHRRYSPGEQLHVSWSEGAVHRFGADGNRIEGP